MSRAIPVPTVSQQCDCKKGYRSRLDAKCEHCRTKKDIDKLNAFWKDVVEGDLREGSWEFKRLRVKHFGACYVIED